MHERYPSDATVLVYLARAQQRLGNHDAARAAYIKVLQLLPDNFEASEFVK
ncbi:MAG: tetratricopeptide repeat protein [Acidiferrobacteraceae bacterium]